MSLKAQYLFLLARILLFFDRRERARSVLEAAARLNPGDADIRSALGHLCAELGDSRAAIEQFTEVLRLQPDNAPVLFNLGFVHHRQHDYEQAVTRFRQAVELKPGIDRAWYGMGLALRSLDRLEESESALDRAAKLQPMNGIAWYELGIANHMLGRTQRVAEIVHYLDGFEPKMTRDLQRVTGIGAPSASS